MLVTNSDFQADFEVVSAFLECNGKLLFLLRKQSKPEGGKWGAPAGKVDAGETLVEAMRRELWEETGLAVSSDQLRYVGQEQVRHGDVAFNYHMYAITLNRADQVILRPNEHEDHVWVTAAEALALPLVTDMADCIKKYYLPTV